MLTNKQFDALRLFIRTCKNNDVYNEMKRITQNKNKSIIDIFDEHLNINKRPLDDAIFLMLSCIQKTETFFKIITQFEYEFLKEKNIDRNEFICQFLDKNNTFDCFYSILSKKRNANDYIKRTRMRSIISNAFTWDGTEQGFDFWFDLSNKLNYEANKIFKLN